MAKKRKTEEKISLDPRTEVKKTQAPPCYNQKAAFCRESLCGRWYKTCEEVRSNDQPG